MRLNQAVGKAFESLILLSANGQDGEVTLIRQHPPVLFRSGGEVVVTGKAWPDWIGFVRARAIAFDAKSTANRTTFRAPADRVHQFLALRRLARLHGVFAFYLVEWRSAGPESDYEIFPVSPGDAWPFVRNRGDGVQFRDLSDAWDWLRSGETSPELEACGGLG